MVLDQFSWRDELFPPFEDLNWIAYYIVYRKENRKSIYKSISRKEIRHFLDPKCTPLNVHA